MSDLNDTPNIDDAIAAGDLKDTRCNLENDFEIAPQRQLQRSDDDDAKRPRGRTALDEIRVLRSPEEIKERLTGLLSVYLSIEADEYFPGDVLNSFAEEMFRRYVSRGTNE